MKRIRFLRAPPTMLENLCPFENLLFSTLRSTPVVLRGAHLGRLHEPRLGKFLDLYRGRRRRNRLWSCSSKSSPFLPALNAGVNGRHIELHVHKNFFSFFLRSSRYFSMAAATCCPMRPWVAPLASSPACTSTSLPFFGGMPPNRAQRNGQVGWGETTTTDMDQSKTSANNCLGRA